MATAKKSTKRAAPKAKRDLLHSAAYAYGYGAERTKHIVQDNPKAVGFAAGAALMAALSEVLS